MAQMVAHQPSKHEAPNSNPSTAPPPKVYMLIGYFVIFQIKYLSPPQTFAISL
jgi:hypothetical protein